MSAYTDLVISLELIDEEVVEIRVSSNQGEASAVQEIPTAILDHGFTSSFDQPTDMQAPDQSVETIGATLFDFLFFPKALALWERTRGEVGAGEEEGVRIKLQSELRRERELQLASLPWQLLFHEPSGGFLALDRRLSISHYLNIPTPVLRLPENEPWRVLVVPSPASLGQRTDREIEHSELLEAWAGAVTLVVLEHGGVSEIRQALAGRERIHAVHFLGHGTFDEKTGWGGLVVEGKSGRPQKLLGPQLTALFRGIEPPLVAVLNACNTGKVGGIEPFAGAGAALVLAGVPSVVAMQRPIRDSMTILFSKHFFGALQTGHSIERAMSEARLHLHSNFAQTFAWGSPTLFTRVSEFRIGAGRPAAEANTQSFSVHGDRGNRVIAGRELVISGRDVSNAEEINEVRIASHEMQSIRRTPHMEVSTPRPVQPGTSFQVTVWADREAAHPGEESEDVNILAPREIQGFELQVWLLTSAHFEVTRLPSKPLALERKEPRSNELTFQVRALSADELKARHEDGDIADLSHGWLSAVFYYQQRPSGKVTRKVEVAIGEAVDEALDENRPVPKPCIHVDTRGRLADLQVHILRDESRPGDTFHVRLAPARLEIPPEIEKSLWRLPAKAEDIVSSFLAEFTKEGASLTDRRLALRGAGVKLFKAAPEAFQKVFWMLVDSDRPPASIAVVTEEPYVPWELMIPNRRNPESGKRETLPPLGVGAAVGRYVSFTSISGEQVVSLKESLLVAPHSKAGALPHARKEIELVSRLFPGKEIQPVTLDNLESQLRAQPVSLLHFACHGAQTNSTTQAIFLDDDGVLTSTQVSGMLEVGEVFEDGRPLVFLNACEVGRSAPALAGVDGFAPAFLDLGACAVVAPLWSVEDEVAHEVAREFYRCLSEEPDTPLAEILRKLRARSFEGDTAGVDSYAAYCFYGDPLAVAIT